MTDKQIIIKFSDGYCIVLENNEVSIRENVFTKFCIVLGKRTNELLEFVKELYLNKKAKEQECDELKKIINEAKNSKLDLKRQNEELQKENERLREEREKAKNYNLEYGQLLIKATNKNNKLLKTLTEIKEITEIEIECKTYEIEHDCFNETRCKALNEHIDFIKQILEKIKECGVKYEN